ncbi:MAG: class I SAM-dependent methyltransferase [Endomicrobiia bacterium]|nr:class I SAM-dependent methyltransferase [Endomicrobiia bacterium]
MQPTNLTGIETMSSAMQYADNYYQWIFDLCKDYIGNEIIDVGSGFGKFIGVLKNKKIIAVDVSPRAIQKIQKEYGASDNITALCGDICSSDFAKRLFCFSVDTVVCFNVLEHIENDITALESIHQILKRKQGNLIIVVPAHQFLYGQMDTLAGHHRRYSKKELEAKLIKPGFQIIRSFYFNSFGFFGWFLNSRVFKPKSLSTIGINSQINLYNKIIPVVKRMDKFLNLPFGQSLFIVAKAK